MKTINIEDFQDDQLTKSEKKVYDCIPPNIANAISLKDLAKITNLSERNVIATVQKLRLKHRLIGSNKLFGYYKITDETELRMTTSPMLEAANSSYKVIQALKDAYALKGGDTTYTPPQGGKSLQGSLFD